MNEMKFRNIIILETVVKAIQSAIANHKLTEDELKDMDEDSVKWGMQIAYDIVGGYLIKEDKPVGTLESLVRYDDEIPEGWVRCDGTEYNIVDYPEFAEGIKKSWGKVNYYGGDGIKTFKVPDLKCIDQEESLFIVKVR